MIGIPYARPEVDDEGLIRICPICNAKIREDSDIDGEQLTNHYGEHYMEEHE